MFDYKIKPFMILQTNRILYYYNGTERGPVSLWVANELKKTQNPDVQFMQ